MRHCDRREMHHYLANKVTIDTACHRFLFRNIGRCDRRAQARSNLVTPGRPCPQSVSRQISPESAGGRGCFVLAAEGGEEVI